MTTITFQSMTFSPDLRTREIQTACFAINHFGDGDHPMATESTLQHFGIQYVILCLTRLIDAKNIQSFAKDDARSALNEIKSARTAQRKGETS